jgi:hypothetical protein
MLVEVSAAIVLLGILLILATQVLAWRATERQDLERRRWALSEARNVIERVTALPPDRLNPDALARLDLGSRVRDALPQGRVDVSLEPSAEDGLVRVGVTVSWAGQVEREDVRLTCYTSGEGGEAP